MNYEGGTEIFTLGFQGMPARSFAWAGLKRQAKLNSNPDSVKDSVSSLTIGLEPLSFVRHTLFPMKRAYRADTRRSPPLGSGPALCRTRLPPRPPVEWSSELQSQFAGRACRDRTVDGIAAILPETSIFLYSYVRKEAVLSSQIEGTQSSLSDLLLFGERGSAWSSD